MEFEDETIISKLEEVFMPHMAKGKADVEANGNLFVHYTSAENALNILKTQRLWLRNPSCMNDYMEISHGYQMLVNFFRNEEKRKKFISAIDAYEEGLAQQIFNAFDEWWDKIKHDTFLASISVHPENERQHGRLSMWRAYGSASGKAALVINNPPKSNKKLNIILSPAAYFTKEDLESELFKIIDAVNENIDYLKSLQKDTVMGTVVVSLIILAVCLKHPGFKEEQEWRLIYLSTMVPENNFLERTVETINGIPQLVYKIPLKNDKDLDITGLNIPELINNILIGPTQFPLPMFDAFFETLLNLDVEDAGDKIRISGIPLRT